MFCENCGVEVPNNTTVCPNCGKTLTPLEHNDLSPNNGNSTDDKFDGFYDTEGQEPAPTYDNEAPAYDDEPEIEPDKPIHNFLVWSILCTIFCCLPCGVVGIVYSSKVNSLISKRRFKDAQSASKKAKIWDIVGTVLGVIGTIFVIIVYSYAIYTGVATQNQ